MRLPLQSKLSRIILLVSPMVSYFVIHFTNIVERGGVEFYIYNDIFERPTRFLSFFIVYYLIPALIAAVGIPWAIDWVKSGT